MTARSTPMMTQYLRMKERHPESILLFRMGDFYEMFFDDAKEAARLLGLTLTSRGRHRGEPIPMAGVPWHSVDGYINRLVQSGRRVAVCDQVEDPKKAKGLVRREVTEVITPGTVMSEDALGRKENRFIASIVPAPGHTGLALADVTTGEFLVGEFAPPAVTDELKRYRPAEILVPEGGAFDPPAGLAATVTTADERASFAPESGRRELLRHLGTTSLDGFGCGDLTVGAGAAGGLLRYLKSLKGGELPHFASLRRLSPGEQLFLDEASLRHLEVLEAPPGGRSLMQTLDRTVTAMGGRYLRNALASPLRHVAAIRSRSEAVERFVADAGLRDSLTRLLSESYDLERLAGRLGCRKATPRDLLSLRRTLERLPELRAQLADRPGRLGELATKIRLFEEIRDELARAIVDDPPAHATDGGILRRGYSTELDEVRAVAADGRSWIAGLQRKERQATGIANLKVGYNRVFGYYIEVTKANLHAVPEHYERKQTLVGAERFVTAELKEKESLILGAEDRRLEIELRLFEALRDSVAREVAALLETARALAEIDFLRSLSVVAAESGYVRPEVHDGEEIRIVDGRHPVVEGQLEEGSFIPNDCEIYPDRRQILLITGPNMAGKSTFLRQVGLVVLLAQVGSFVPARSAVIGVADRIFTRVGASDNIARGQSTFLVEMHESANILHNATSRSLVLLDEVGRGTSTFDGLSIAWAMTEYLHDGMRGRPRTLFATHFHELTRLAARLRRVVNLRVEVKEWEDQVVFLHNIVEGKADRSYGIHVAQMAGLPEAVIQRAKAILEELEDGGATAEPHPARVVQTVLPLFPEPAKPAPSALETEIAGLNVNAITPLEALALLQRLQSELKRDR